MADDQRVDPRYDPAFQRGFEGEVASTLRRPARPPREPQPTSLPSPHPPPAAPEIPAAEAPAAAAAPAPAPEPPARALTSRELVRNPYLVALALLGVALIVVGAVWAVRARQMVTMTDPDYWFLQASVFAAPLATVTGLAMIGAVLAVFAVAWNRRAAAAPAD